MNLVHRTTLFNIAVFVAAIVCVGVYAAGLNGPFLMDDFDAIFPLAAAEASGGWWETLTQAPSHIRARWLSNLSFVVTQAATGSAMPPQAWAYKAGNLALHIACAAAMLLLASRVLRIAGVDAGRAKWLALVTAAIFALHPLLVSTVLYPVQRMAQLATLFALLAVWAYVRWREFFATSTPKQHAAGLALTIGFMGLALLSKESGVLAPLLIGAAEISLFRWPAKEHPQRGRFDAGFGLLCAAPLMLGLVLFGVRWKSLMAGYDGRDFGLGERVLTQLHVLADYLAQIFWPRIGGMGLYRDDFPITSSVDAPTAILALVFALAIAGAIALRRRWPVVGFGVLWFFAAHALESSVLPLELVFEHRNYLALFGPALAVAWLVGHLPGRSAAAAAIAILLALGVQTARRAAEWGDYERWIRSEVAHRPGSLRAAVDLVMYLSDRSDPAQARRALEAAQTRFPEHAQPAILALGLHCRTAPGSVSTVPADDIRRLRSGIVGKDAFHLFVGIKENKFAGRCNGVGWPAFATVAASIAENPTVAAYPTAAAAWHRLHAQALSESGDWAGVTGAIERALAQQDNDPRDWLLLMRASLQQNDLSAYAGARARLMQLTGGNLGRLGPQLSELDALARRTAPVSGR